MVSIIEISPYLGENIIAEFRAYEDSLVPRAGKFFPQRKRFNVYNPVLIEAILAEIVAATHRTFVAHPENIRIYKQDYGEVKPHTDTTTYENYDHTCIIYLTKFVGGELTIEDKKIHNRA